MALKLADYVVTEAGFASDLGFQKFCDIVCRSARFTPSAAVLVTTVRATKSHGGKPFNVLGNEDLDARSEGRRQPRRARADRPRIRAAVRRADQQLPDRLAERDWRSSASWRSRPARKPWSCTRVSPRAARARWSWRRRSSRRATSRTRSRSSRRRARRSCSRSRRSPRRSTARPGSISRCRRARISSGSRSSVSARAGVHGEDAAVAVARSHAAQPADRVHRAGPRAGAERRRRVRRRAVRRDAADAGLGKTPAFMNAADHRPCHMFHVALMDDVSRIRKRLFNRAIDFD